MSAETATSAEETARRNYQRLFMLRNAEIVLIVLGLVIATLYFELALPLPPLLATLTFAINGAILLEAGLSFLGVGIPLPTASWGNMLETARSLDVLQDGPWIWIPPALFILLTILSINFIGDGLRDALDPKHIV